MSKDRSMATGPYPAKALRRKVIVEGAWCGGGYRQRVTGYQTVIVLSDGSEVVCKHPYGHKNAQTLRACANRLVRDLNDAVGIPRDKQ